MSLSQNSCGDKKQFKRTRLCYCVHFLFFVDPRDVRERLKQNARRCGTQAQQKTDHKGAAPLLPDAGRDLSGLTLPP